MNTIYPTLPDARTTERSDLVLILGQGVPGLNQTNAEGLFDMLRLNLAVPPTAEPNPLGRRSSGTSPASRTGAACRTTWSTSSCARWPTATASSSPRRFGLPNLSPNNLVGDGCNVNDKPFLKSFPYAAAPNDGYDGGDHRVPCKKGF